MSRPCLHHVITSGAVLLFSDRWLELFLAFHWQVRDLGSGGGCPEPLNNDNDHNGSSLTRKTASLVQPGSKIIYVFVGNACEARLFPTGQCNRNTATKLRFIPQALSETSRRGQAKTRPNPHWMCRCNATKWNLLS